MVNNDFYAVGIDFALWIDHLGSAVRTVPQARLQ